MLIGQAVPEGLAAMPPGPELARVLADLDVSAVPNDDVVDLLKARARQLAHDQAQMFEAMSEVICRRPFAGPMEIVREGVPDRYGADEVRAALHWTRRFADSETDLAYTLVHVLPRVQRALSTGLIDRGQAWVFAHHLADLTPEQTTAICAELLPIAPRLTTGQIAERIKRMILELDPAYYERRYRKAISERMVVGYLSADGTAVISAGGLPADEAAAAWERLDALARTARRDGHPGTLHQIRADLVLGLLDGSLNGLDRDEILQALLERFAGRVEPAAEECTGTLVPVERHGHNSPPSSPVPSSPVPSNPRPGGSEADGAGTGSSGAGDGREDAGSGSGVGRTSARTDDQRVGTEIRVPLSTVLELDDRAGELPGWGPIPASAARRVVARQRRAQWRWVVVDDTGQLWAEGVTRRRPTGSARGGPRGGIVELQVPASLLGTLAADAERYGPWAGVIADVAARFDAQLVIQSEYDRAEQSRAEHPRAERGPGGRGLLRADLDAHPDDRFPRAPLRRHVQVRDRTCVHPGCRCPAVKADLDHTLDHVYGGATTQDDLSPLCRHHHMLKTEGGWRLEQPEPGRFVWHSPLGRVYPVRPEPILPPPPGPVTRELDPGFDEPARDDNDYTPDLTVRERAPPPRESDPGPSRPSEAETGRDDPPF